MIGDKYLRCGKPSVVQVQHRGRSEGPYFMCLEHGWHNVKNRDAEAIDMVDALKEQEWLLKKEEP